MPGIILGTEDTALSEAKPCSHRASCLVRVGETDHPQAKPQNRMISESNEKIKRGEGIENLRTREMEIPGEVDSVTGTVSRPRRVGGRREEDEGGRGEEAGEGREREAWRET